MTQSTNALLVFCEGQHDVAYVRMLLQEILEFKIVSLPFKELPSPFHHLFKQSVATHAAGDLSLDMAHKFFLPETILRNKSQFILLYNCGGNTQYDKVRELLSDYLPIIPQARVFAEDAKEIIDHVKYLFLYDADSVGINRILEQVNHEFRVISESNFFDAEWSSSSSDFGRVSGDKAVYVWGERAEQGTLEDILYPMFSLAQPSLLSKAESAIDDMFTWDVDNPDIVKAVSEISKRKKSVITVIGQKKKPGSSLNVIIDQSKFLRKDTLTNNGPTQDFVRFISEFIGLAL
jgi:hypothetical protein